MSYDESRATINQQQATKTKERLPTCVSDAFRVKRFIVEVLIFILASCDLLELLLIYLRLFR